MMTQTQPFEQADESPFMEESRKFERFSLNLPTRISCLESGHSTLDLITDNISAGGAYFSSRESFEEGLKVLVELTLKRESGQGGASKVQVKGTVLRSLPDGMAISFESRVQMQSV